MRKKEVKIDDLNDDNLNLEPITATKIKNWFGEVLFEILSEKKKFVVTRSDKPVAVIMPYPEYLELQRVVQAKKKPS